ncbi:Holliday junction branch migration protein RuvA [Trueperella sp. LYQ143]|uniref:Holliday junction branch migration protein RuvA n=1 Tax=Trueperella sp. LYQ143 TaxID=3391059 RepID=UPI003983658C
MIASLRGPVLLVTTTHAVIEAGGVGMMFLATPATLAALRVGEESLVYTSMVISRENDITLFGFADMESRTAFDILRSVSGIGPRSALQILAALELEELRGAIERGDEATLTRIPGVGKKSAQRMVLELRGKLGAPRSDSAASIAPGADDIVQALVGMGWNERDAVAAVEVARGEQPNASAPQMLRAALQVLGTRRNR